MLRIKIINVNGEVREGELPTKDPSDRDIAAALDTLIADPYWEEYAGHELWKGRGPGDTDILFIGSAPRMGSDPAERQDVELPDKAIKAVAEIVRKPKLNVSIT